MSSREWFGVVLRTVSLLLVLYSLGIAASIAAIWAAPPLDDRQFGAPGLFPMQNLLLGPSLTALGALAVGAYLLRGAPAVLAFSYPEAKADRVAAGVAR